MKLTDFLRDHNYDPKIKIDLIKDDMGEFDSILIDGDRNTMRFLSDLFKILSDDESEESISLSPNGAGSIYFTTESKLGIYLSLAD